MLHNFINGIFIEECKNRFLCKVEVNGKQETCYISSSSKLSHFLNLTNREVLLTKNIGSQTRTRYTVHAVKTIDGYILLNLGLVNKLLKFEFNKINSIYSCSDAIYCEKKINDALKVDFLIEGKQKIIIEAKGVITEASIAHLPSIAVDRALMQLKAFVKLLTKDYSIHYYVVLMNPNIKQLVLNKEYLEFRRTFMSCIRKGMKVFIYKVGSIDRDFSLVRETTIENEFLARL